MHDWSDETFDWKGLWQCTGWFPRQLHRYARFNMTSCKEKYGTMRLEWVGCCHRGIYGLLFPGRLHARNWFMPINNYITAIADKLRLYKLFWLYQRLIFNLVTVRAVQKWPHIMTEITSDFEFQEWLYPIVKRHIGFKDHWT